MGRKISWKKQVVVSRPSSWEHLKGDAPEPGTKVGPEPLPPGPPTTYGTDQDSQLKKKMRDAEAVLAVSAANVARAIIEQRYHEVDFALEKRVAPKLAILLGPDGSERSGDWLVAELARVEATRIQRWELRKNSKGEVGYRPRDIVRSWKNETTGKMVSTGTRREEWAFGMGPKYSYGICLAADEGQPALARRFLLTLSKAYLRVFRKATNDPHLIANACHVKPWNTHEQTTWSAWSDPQPDPAGKRKELCCLPVGGADVPNRMFSSASLSTGGQLQQQALGLDLPKLTGRKDALARAQFFLEKASRHQSPLNYVLTRWMRLYAHHLLSKEEWAPLRPFVERGRAEYERRKAEQLAEVATQTDLMAAAAERARLQELVRSGEAQHAEALRLAAAKEDELKAAAKAQQEEADAKVRRAERDVAELVEEIHNREALHSEAVAELKENVDLAEEAREDAVERERAAANEAADAKATANAVVGELASVKADAAVMKAALAAADAKVQALRMVAVAWAPSLERLIEAQSHVLKLRKPTKEMMTFLRLMAAPAPSDSSYRTSALPYVPYEVRPEVQVFVDALATLPEYSARAALSRQMSQRMRLPKLSADELEDALVAMTVRLEGVHRKEDEQYFTPEFETRLGYLKLAVRRSEGALRSHNLADLISAKLAEIRALENNGVSKEVSTAASLRAKQAIVRAQMEAGELERNVEIGDFFVQSVEKAVGQTSQPAGTPPRGGGSGPDMG